MFRRTKQPPRLDPVRWRAPSAARMVRLVLVALLVTGAAALGYTREPQPCAPAAARPAPLPSAGARRTVPPGALGVPVRLAEPAALALVRPGDRVDLIAVQGDTARPVATAALVLRLDGSAELGSGGLLLALEPAAARHAVSAPPDTRFTVVVRPAE